MVQNRKYYNGQIRNKMSALIASSFGISTEQQMYSIYVELRLNMHFTLKRFAAVFSILYQFSRAPFSSTDHFFYQSPSHSFLIP